MVHRNLPSRRAALRVGGASLLGVSFPQLLAAADSPEAKHKARAKSVIFLHQWGGPGQHETFDPKPDAPAEIRGPFKPINTNVPGVRFCELLPRTARHADKLAVIRSLSTRDDNHDVSGYWLLTGYPYGPGSARQIKPGDWPYFGSVVKMLKPSEVVPALASLWIPDLMRLNDNVTPAGQTAGFLGKIAIHPDQIAIINEAFTPSSDEIAKARRIVAAFHQSPGVGTLQLDGEMLDRPHLKQALRVLAGAPDVP